MSDGGYMNLPAKPTDQTTASIGGTPRTSPADDLRVLLAEAQPTDYYGNLVDRDGAEEWLSRNGAAVLALIDAAQATVDNAALVCDEEILLDRALRALKEPKP